MTTWTDPKSWATGELVTAADLNTYLRDNLLFLRDVTAFNMATVDGAFSTSSTAWVDVDPANLSLTVATQAGSVLLIGAAMTVTLVNGRERAHFDIAINGNRQGSVNGLVSQEALHNSNILATEAMNVNFQHFVTSLAAGTHTFTLQWRATGINPVSIIDTAAGGISVQMYVMEFAA